jgi:uncharacterized protein YdiU (UPF0061 family)
MSALGVPTTRALAAISSGDPVYRNRLEPGAVLTRVASSHLRVGTVQYFAMTRSGEGLAELVDYVVQRHFSDRQDDQNAALTLLDGVCAHFANLVSHWQVLGFVHGVLNTDNALLCGETIDYGPCAFMDHFDPTASFSSIDRQGRYAWPNQPGIMHWNLAVLAECLLPLIDTDPTVAQQQAQAVVDRYAQRFHHLHQSRLAAKLGLDTVKEADGTLVQAFHDVLASERLDFTLAFRWLTEYGNDTVAHSPLPELFHAPTALTDWAQNWQARRKENTGDTEALNAAMRNANPVVIPRNHLVQRAIELAEAGELDWIHAWVARAQTPFAWDGNDLEWARPPSEEERVTQTFCGT